uniref:Uncharacterized protein n=1 Tax=Tetranychus urticae TaxID=32264 RepID=T1KDM4_TETUR
MFDPKLSTIFQPLEVPAIDFFFPMVTVLNFSTFYHRRPTELVYWCKVLFNKPNVTINSVQEFDQHCSNLSLLVTRSTSWLPALLTVGDVEELTQDPRELIDEIYSFNDIRKNLFDTKICTKKRFLNGYGLFVRISCRNGSLPFTRENTSGLGGNNFILENRIKVPYTFRFASGNRSIGNQGSQYIFIEPPKNKYTILTNKIKLTPIVGKKLTLTELLVAFDSVLAVYFGDNDYDKSRLEGLNKFFVQSCNQQQIVPKERVFIIVRPNSENLWDSSPFSICNGFQLQMFVFDKCCIGLVDQFLRCHSVPIDHVCAIGWTTTPWKHSKNIIEMS